MAVNLPLADELAAIFARASELLLTDETVSEALELITEAAGLGLRSSVSAPLLAGGSALGAVRLYGREAGSFDQNTVSLLELFAAQATIFLTNVQARESARNISAELQDAMAHREIIAVAKGILMARHGLDEDTAMQDLLMESRRAKRSLRDISAELVSSTRLSR